MKFDTAPNPPPPDLANEAFSRSSLVFTMPIAAGAMVSMPVYGDAFYLIGCTAPVEIRTDQTSEKPYRKGTGERFPAALRFGRLEIRNPNSNPVLVTLWAGFGEYIDNRFEVVDGYTVARGWTGTQINAGATVTFTGAGTGNQIQRKAFVITNLDPNNNLLIRDAAGNTLCAVFKETSITLPIAGPVQVHNATGAPISCAIGEIFYSENGN